MIDKVAASVGAYIALAFLVVVHAYIFGMMYLHMKEVRCFHRKKEGFLSVPGDRFYGPAPPPGTAHLAFPTRDVDGERHLAAMTPPRPEWAAQPTRCFSCENEVAAVGKQQFTHPNKCLSCEGHPDHNAPRT